VLRAIPTSANISKFAGSYVQLEKPEKVKTATTTPDASQHKSGRAAFLVVR
jgi:hypothetical protein